MATGTAEEELREALYTKLRDDATLLSLLGPDPDAGTKARVYDEPPDNAALPYIVIGDAVASRFNTFGVTGREFLIDIHCYSAHRGYQEVNQVLGRVEAMLDHQHANLTVTGYTVARCMMDDTNTMREPPLVRHGIARYRINLQEA